MPFNWSHKWDLPIAYIRHQWTVQYECDSLAFAVANFILLFVSYTLAVQLCPILINPSLISTHLIHISIIQVSI